MPGAGNVISGNNGIGVWITGPNGSNVIQGNLIGTDKTGAQDLGNTSDGIFVSASPNNTIGGFSSSTLDMTRLFQWSPAAGGNGHYYVVTQSPANWLDAEALAVSLGGHLVGINSAAEQSFLENTFVVAPYDRQPYWMGFTDQAVEGTFVWTSGEPVTY